MEKASINPKIFAIMWQLFEEKETNQMKEIVQSVDRALSILEILSDYSEGLGITSISNKVNIHKSTVHRILATLIYKGYVEQDPNTNNYMITLKLFELDKKGRKYGFVRDFKPYTEKL